MKKIRIVPGLFPVAGIWLALALWCWLRPADEISMSERRKLAQFPEASPEKILPEPLRRILKITAEISFR